MAEGGLRCRRDIENDGIFIFGGDNSSSVDVDEKIKMLQKISTQERN